MMQIDRFTPFERLPRAEEGSPDQGRPRQRRIPHRFRSRRSSSLAHSPPSLTLSPSHQVKADAVTQSPEELQKEATRLANEKNKSGGNSKIDQEVKDQIEGRKAARGVEG